MRNYRKVTKEMKNLMIQMKAEGSTNQRIAKTLGIYQSTVQYHLDKKQRAKQIARSMKNEKPRDRKEYMRKYRHERYHNDLEFQEKVKKVSRENKHRKANGKTE